MGSTPRQTLENELKAARELVRDLRNEKRHLQGDVRALESEIGRLVAYFREEDTDAGRDGDDHNRTPTQQAIYMLRAAKKGIAKAPEVSATPARSLPHNADFTSALAAARYYLDNASRMMGRLQSHIEQKAIENDSR